MEKHDKFTAFFPMKEHSARLSDKNIRQLLGRPLFYYTLDVLNNADWISEIIINTDSVKIASLAKHRSSKIKIIKRSQKVLADNVTMNKIINEDIEKAENDLIIQTHATNPLLSLSTLTAAKDLYCKNLKTNDSLFSVNKISTRCYDDRKTPINHDPGLLVNTQELKPVFEENSLFYFFSKKSFFKNENRIGITPLFYETPKLESCDIDTEEDFYLARAILELKFKN